MSEPSVGFCSNCGSEKNGQFCAHCGQNSRNYLRGAHRVLAEIFLEIFDLESRLFRTLKFLIFYPGYLTREFVEGRRAQYLSPGRLYLVLSMTFFFVLSVNTNVMPGSFEFDVDGEPEGIAADASEWEKAFETKIEAVLVDPNVGVSALIENLPLLMFLMLPVFALLMKLAYFRSYYTQHLVFSLHFHAFLFLVFSVQLLLPDEEVAGIWDDVDAVLSLVLCVYFYLSLKRVYDQSHLRTTFKMFGLSLSYALLLLLGLLFAFLITIYFL